MCPISAPSDDIHDDNLSARVGTWETSFKDDGRQIAMINISWNKINVSCWTLGPGSANNDLHNLFFISFAGSLGHRDHPNSSWINCSSNSQQKLTQTVNYVLEIGKLNVNTLANTGKCSMVPTETIWGKMSVWPRHHSIIIPYFHVQNHFGMCFAGQRQYVPKP